MSDIEEQYPTFSSSTSSGGVRAGREDIRKQSKVIIANVYKFFKNLAYNEEARRNINFAQVRKLTAEACGISEQSVQRISNTVASADDQGVSVVFSSPRKGYKREHKNTELDDFNKQIVRRTVLEYYDRGEYPTASKIRADLCQKINYSGSEASVLRLLKVLGFKFKKCNDGRKFLMERRDIAALRAKFLRTMHIHRTEDNRPIIYLDETWISQNHTNKYIWQDSRGNGGLKVPTGRGGRLIIAHAGSASTGFIAGAKLVFRGSKHSAASDYHTEMNAEVFKTWFVGMLRSLEEGSVIVMDNASYHSVQIDKPPCSNWRKADIMEWLRKKRISFSTAETRDELLSKEEIRTAKKTYELDQLANEMGHTVVRLPPYHCQYNPIELIWAQVKRYVANKNTTFRLADIEQLAHEALDRITQEDWEKCVRHAEALQEADYSKQCTRDTTVEPFIIHLRVSSDSEPESSESEDE